MFAEQEGKRGGEFFTPSCVVRTLVEVLQPFNGRVYEMKAPKLIQFNYSSTAMPGGYSFGKRVHFAGRVHPGCFHFMEVAA
jgi:hypothetical protein